MTPYLEYSGVLPTGEPFAITRPETEWDYADFRCEIAGKEVKVKEVLRYRDGGTTIIETEAGRFWFPSPFRPEAKATFNGEVIQWK